MLTLSNSGRSLEKLGIASEVGASVPRARWGPKKHSSDPTLTSRPNHDHSEQNINKALQHMLRTKSACITVDRSCVMTIRGIPAYPKASVCKKEGDLDNKPTRYEILYIIEQ